tara:strand:- start:23822 stop:25372 length:1551 start_codon:yes stop_codon:yes gene_type:complete
MMRRRIRRMGTFALLISVLTGCSLEPAYVRPKLGVEGLKLSESLDLVAVEEIEAGSSSLSDAMAETHWRVFLTDTTLRSLVETAIANNRDLRVAALNIERTQAQYRIRRSELLPNILADGVEQVQKYPSGVSAISGQSSGTGSGSVSRGFSAGLGLTAFELDLFGRIRSLEHAALEQYFSSIEAHRSVQISLIAEVANAYLALRSDQALLQLAADTLESRQSSHQLIQRSNEYGVSDDLDLSQAQQAIHTAEADVARYQRRIAQDRNALRLLVATSLPEQLDETAESEGKAMLEDLPAGLSSEVLTRRPDVLAAEHELIARNASIGAARAAFFPTISLTARYGTASRELGGLFESGSEAWTFAPRISLPIFAAGANKANLDVAKIDRDISVASYQKTVQTAFREVSDALAARGTLDAQLEAEESLVKAAQTSYELSKLRFDFGVDNYLVVLDSQRTYYGAQKDVISTRLARQQNLVTLYKALGGGWGEATDSMNGNSASSAESATVMTGMTLSVRP